jgi:hypothetical protein
MDAIKGLRYALVMVLITSVVLLGWTIYLERRLDRKLQNFASAIGQVKSEQGARFIIQQFLSDTHKQPIANSATADQKECWWLCE